MPLHTLGRLAVVAWLFTTLLGLAGLATLLYVAAHFLQKVW